MNNELSVGDIQILYSSLWIGNFIQVYESVTETIYIRQLRVCPDMKYYVLLCVDFLKKN